jgi:hypothetical protein
MGPQSIRGQELKKNKPQNITNPIPKHAKHTCMLLCCYGSKMICRTKGDIPIALKII